MKHIRFCLFTIVVLLGNFTATGQIEEPIDLAANADQMLYTNAKCTNEKHGDQFVGWHVLFDNDANTFFHSEYSNVNSEDGQDHYLRVDLGEESKVKTFSFTYTVRGTIPYNGNYSPKTMVVEGSNTADGEYTEIATLTDLPNSAAAVYESGILGNGNDYRYIRFRVTETFQNSKVQGHPYFFMAEFGMMKVRIGGTCGDNLSWKLTDENELIIEGTGRMYEYAYDEMPWYEYRDSIQTITIGDKVISIGGNAFSGCSNLTSITIPESVTSIGDKAFKSCSSLTSITIPESVTSIGDYAFNGCTALKKVIIEDGSTTLSLGYNYYGSSYDSSEGEGLFYDCPLEEVYLGRNLSYNNGGLYGYSPFYKKTQLTALTIGDKVTSIGESAFNGCTALKKVIIEDGSTTLSLGYNYYSVYTGKGLFYDCPLEEVYLGRDLSYYSNSSSGYSPFYNKTQLTALTIGDKVTSIGDYAFTNCRSLTAITIPESVTSIVNYAFSGCSNLTAVYISSIEAWCKITFENSESNPLYHAHNLYLNGELVTNLVIPEGVTSIENGAFNGCSSLTAITIPESMTSIGNEAFNGCTALKKVIIEDGSTTLSLGYNYYNYGGGKGLFYDCPLEEVYLGRNLSYGTSQSEGFSPFYNKTTLESPTIGDKVTSIGGSAFESCSSLTSITIPESVTSIGDWAFSNCSSLTAITIPENVTSIENGAFNNCCSLTAITIPENVTSIGNRAFNGCTALKKVIIEDGSTTLSLGYNYYNSSGTGEGLFYYCPLEEVYLGRELSYDSDISCGYSPFYNKTKLTALTIGDKVTSIGDYAFKECNNLTAITIPAGVTLIGESAFSTPDRVIWLANTPPTGYTYVEGRINYAPNDKYSTLSNVKIYPYLGSMFEVGGLKYVPVNPTERTCDAIDCAYNNAAEAIMIGEVVSFKGTAMTLKAVMPFTFSGNKYIKEVHISHKGNIGDYAFYNCDSIQSVVLTHEGNVGKYVFGYCKSLNTITLGEKIRSLGDYVFAGCSSLTDVIIEDRTSALALGSNGSSSLFVDCPLDSVYIGGTITYNATSDKGYSPFNTNETLRAVVISDHAEQIYDYAFYDCANLQSIIIGDGVKRIGNYAFSKCSSLDSVTLSKNIKALGIETFAGCSDLKGITCYACVPPTCGEQALNGIDILECQLKVPTGCMDAYKAADQWKDFFFIEDVLEVAKYTITYMVDNEVYKSVDYTYDESIIAEDNPIKEGYTFGGWSWIKKEKEASPIDLASNADAMLYTNAKCTNTMYGDEFKGWHVLYDGNANTFFHSEYSNVDSEDGQDHYLRVDMGKSVSEFTFTYTTRGKIPTNGNYSPKTMVVEGSNKADGEYAKIATLTNLPNSAAAVYESGILGNGNAYRYIRFRVTETFQNAKVQGHPYFFMAEFGIAECIEKQVETSGVPTTMPAEDIVIHGSFVENNDGDDATGIDNEQLAIDNGQLTIYDLQGRRVEKPTKGMYIVNGKKVVIK